jgi:hypothetical protein
MSNSIRIAIVINPALPLGLVANTVGAIAIGLGARLPVLAGTRLSDGQGRTIDVSSNQPVPILAADADVLRGLTLKAIACHPDLAVVPFPAFARSLHAFADYQRSFPQRDLSVETIDGLGLAGADKLVRSLTGSLRLLR